MDFIDKEHGLLTKIFHRLGLRDGCANILDAAHHCWEVYPACIGCAGDQLSQSGLAGPGWPPQQHGMQLATTGNARQRLAGRQQMLLADKFRKRGRSQSIG